MKYSRLIAAALALCLWGCGGEEDPRLKLRFRYWSGTNEGAVAMQALVLRFEAANPDLRIIPERKATGPSYEDVLLAEFASGTAPDVIYISTDNIDALAATGHLADLSRLLEGDKGLRASDFYAPLLARFSRGKSLYALPRDLSPVSCVYYNKGLFDKAGLAYPKDGWTWDDLRSLARRLTLREPGKPPSQMGFGDDWNLMDAWVCAGNGRLVDDSLEPTRITLDEPAAMKGILYRWKLLQKDQVMPQEADTQTFGGGAMALFMSQKLAMFHSGLWKIAALRQVKDFDWDVVRFPRAPGESRPSYFGGGSGYAMLNQEKKREASWRFIRYMGGEEGQKALAKDVGLLPALKKLARSPAFLDGQKPLRKAGLLPTADRCVFLPSWKYWREFRQGTFGPATDPIWAPGFEGDPAEAVRSAVAKGNARFFPPAK